MKRPLIYCQKRLASLWYIWTGVLIILLLAQLAGNYFGDSDASIPEIFTWFFSNTLPFLSLITGAWTLAVNDGKNNCRRRFADNHWYNITLWISVFYLTLLTVVPLLPTFGFFERTPLRFMQAANAFLVPIQSIALLALGAFFTRSLETNNEHS